MNRIILFFLLLAGSYTSAWTQEPLTLQDCYDFAHDNFPLLKQNALFEKQTELDKKVVENNKMPKFDLAAQATYQSDVIALPITLPPTMGSISPPNKDQYKATLSVNQLIYSGGVIQSSLDVKDAALEVQKAETEVSLYQLKQQINQMYFSILLLQEKKPLLKAKEDLLNDKLEELRSAIRNGMVTPNSDKIIEIELVKTHQQFIEIEANRKALLSSLSTLIGKEIPLETALQNPSISQQISGEIMRPELELFKLKQAQITSAEKLFEKQNSPKLVAFATGGYGNPGLNMLDNSFQPFYIVGLKASWNIYDFKLAENKQKSLAINKEIIANKEEVFRLNTKIEIEKTNTEIEKIEALIVTDSEIIEMRRVVLKSLESQLKNGVITPTTYTTEVTNLFQSENSLKTHEIQLLLAKANLQVTQGI